MRDKDLDRVTIVLLDTIRDPRDIADVLAKLNLIALASADALEEEGHAGEAGRWGTAADILSNAWDDLDDEV